MSFDSHFWALTLNWVPGNYNKLANVQSYDA